MNDKDKELVEWKEAARSEAEEVNRLQKEINDLKNLTYWTVEQNGNVTRHISIADVEKLQTENKKLREALEFYANKYSWQGTHIGPSDYWFDDKQGYYFGGLRAREALKEVRKE